jgi:hypothetical protein
MQAAQKKVPHHPVCVMNAGYSSGWTGVSMGNVDLVAAEVMCMARGTHTTAQHSACYTFCLLTQTP